MEKDYQKQNVPRRSSSKEKSMDLTNDFLVNWRVNMEGRRSFYLRDTLESRLLVNYSRKGTHSFSYDYRKGKIHFDDGYRGNKNWSFNRCVEQD